MIREIRFRTFKCFQTLDLSVRPLTVLSGINASGKSTVVQALALLEQSVVDAEFAGSLILDGSAISLGTVADVVDKLNGSRAFGLGLGGDEFSVDWTFGGPAQSRDSSTMQVGGLHWRTNHGSTGVEGDDVPPLRGLLPSSDVSETATSLRALLARIDHVGAERLGPRETYRLGNEAWHDRVGTNGERAAGALWWFGDEAVSAGLCLDDAVPTVRAQTQAWLHRFFPGVVFQVERVPNANAVTLAFRTSDQTNFHRPQHVGYGITHLLPIIVAGLRAPGRVLVVENPEVHLHPAGQAAVGAFLGRVAMAGATVIVETHSDHVLNGVRRLVRDGGIAPEDVALHFFRERSSAQAAGLAQVVTPRFDAHGNIDTWPTGFFDQFDLDMSYLAGLG